MRGAWLRCLFDEREKRFVIMELELCKLHTGQVCSIPAITENAQGRIRERLFKWFLVPNLKQDINLSDLQMIAEGLLDGTKYAWATEIDHNRQKVRKFKPQRALKENFQDSLNPENSRIVFLCHLWDAIRKFCSCQLGSCKRLRSGGSRTTFETFTTQYGLLDFVEVEWYIMFTIARLKEREAKTSVFEQVNHPMNMNLERLFQLCELPMIKFFAGNNPLPDSSSPIWEFDQARIEELNRAFTVKGRSHPNKGRLKHREPCHTIDLMFLPQEPVYPPRYNKFMEVHDTHTWNDLIQFVSKWGMKDRLRGIPHLHLLFRFFNENLETVHEDDIIEGGDVPSRIVPDDEPIEVHAGGSPTVETEPGCEDVNMTTAVARNDVVPEDQIEVMQQAHTDVPTPTVTVAVDAQTPTGIAVVGPPATSVTAIDGAPVFETDQVMTSAIAHDGRVAEVPGGDCMVAETLRSPSDKASHSDPREIIFLDIQPHQSSLTAVRDPLTGRLRKRMPATRRLRGDYEQYAYIGKTCKLLSPDMTANVYLFERLWALLTGGIHLLNICTKVEFGERLPKMIQEFVDLYFHWIELCGQQATKLFDVDYTFVKNRSWRWDLPPVIRFHRSLQCLDHRQTFLLWLDRWNLLSGETRLRALVPTGNIDPELFIVEKIWQGKYSCPGFPQCLSLRDRQNIQCSQTRFDSMLLSLMQHSTAHISKLKRTSDQKDNDVQVRGRDLPNDSIPLLKRARIAITDTENTGSFANLVPNATQGNVRVLMTSNVKLENEMRRGVAHLVLFHPRARFAAGVPTVVRNEALEACNAATIMQEDTRCHLCKEPFGPSGTRYIYEGISDVSEFRGGPYQLDCGHRFHFSCVRQRWEDRIIESRCTISLAKICICPICANQHGCCAICGFALSLKENPFLQYVHRIILGLPLSSFQGYQIYEQPYRYPLRCRQPTFGERVMQHYLCRTCYTQWSNSITSLRIDTEVDDYEEEVEITPDEIMSIPGPCCDLLLCGIDQPGPTLSASTSRKKSFTTIASHWDRLVNLGKGLRWDTFRYKYEKEISTAFAECKAALMQIRQTNN